jgi:hypothetical protein
MDNVSKNSNGRQQKPLQPAQVGPVVWLSTPIPPSDIWPEGASGILQIGDTVYICKTLLHITDETEIIVDGWQLEKADGTAYTIDSTGECDCPDACWRGFRPGGCKHVRGLARALKQLELQAPPCPAPNQYRSTGDFARNDPEGYRAAMNAYPDDSRKPAPPVDGESWADAEWTDHVRYEPTELRDDQEAQQQQEPQDGEAA